MILSGKTAVVTGASRGIGKAIALALAREGARVAVNFRENEAAALAVVEEIKGLGGEAAAVRADVGNRDDVKRLAAVTLERFGRLDILVNNAGLVRDNYVTFMTDEEWDVVLDTILKGSFQCIRCLGREMVRRKSGRIIKISSDGGMMGDLMR